MARPLRIDIPDGWYHVMARGSDRRVLFEDDREHAHFLELLEEMVARYGVRLHAYVLMGNHYHLLVQTPHANLSRAMQWLNVSYGVWFNRRRGRVGPLLQGRFKAVLIDGEGSWALLASVYLHLNPVRIKGLGLGKRERKADQLGISPPPTPEMVKARLETLREHRWSSYLAYAGYQRRPGWLTCEDLWQRAKQRELEPQASYRQFVEDPLKAGVAEMETLADRIKETLAVGSAAFLDRLRRRVRGNRHEQPAVRSWQRLLPFTRVAAAVAKEKGEPWARFRDRHGDWGRDAALWLARRHCGMTQAELGEAAGGMAYPAVGHAVRRIERRRQNDSKLNRVLTKLEGQLVENAT
jgi:REP element-mobilizing transposase RayT